MIISNIYIYIYSYVNVCIYEYVIRPPQTKISSYAPVFMSLFLKLKTIHLTQYIYIYIYIGKV